MSKMMIGVTGTSSIGSKDYLFLTVEAGSHEAVRALVRTVLPVGNKYTRKVSDFAGELYSSAQKYGYNPELTDRYNYTQFFPKVDKYYLFDLKHDGQIDLLVYNIGRRARTATPNSEFQGDLNGFEGWINPTNKILNDLREKKSKLLRFNYKGGTNSGVRIIRLEDVSGTGKNVLLKGVDMSHALDPKSTDKGYRTYKLDKIVGEIEVLN